MKSLALLVCTLIIGTACTKRTLPKRVENNRQESTKLTPTPMSEAAATAKESEENENPPPAFIGIDFKTFSYLTNLRGKVTLKNGTRVYENPEGGGGDSFDLRDVNYADMTGDGKEEAIVHLSAVSCGVSCDGGSHLFYFYSAAQTKPRLLSRIETGSAAYDECGLKSFVLSKGKLSLELFRICRFRGLSFQSLYDADYKGGKFEARHFTRFLFQFNGKRFVIKKRDVLPFPNGEVLSYQETVSVTTN